MQTLVLLGASALAITAIATFVAEARHAPIGDQDDRGFHPGPSTPEPAANLTVASAMPAPETDWPAPVSSEVEQESEALLL